MNNSNENKWYLHALSDIKNKKQMIATNEFILEKVKTEHPELFFWNHTSYRIESGARGSYAVLNYMYSDNECKYIEQKAKKVAASCKCHSDEMTVRKIHNYLVHNISYDHAGIGKPENHNAGGVFLYNKSVCEGISKAFQWLCHLCGIECSVIEGTLAGDSHMWNIVKIDGKNYHIDVTQDIATTDKKWNKPSYMFYLITDNEIKKDHIFNADFNCVHTEANPFYKAGKVFRSDKELQRYLKNVPRTERLIYFKYFGGMSKNSIVQLVASELQSSVSMIENGGTYYIERTNNQYGLFK